MDISVYDYYLLDGEYCLINKLEKSPEVMTPI